MKTFFVLQLLDGSFMYTQICTKPNIAFVIGPLARNYKESLRYPKGAKDFMLTYRQTNNIQVFG